jgi:hypothetical protein
MTEITKEQRIILAGFMRGLAQKIQEEFYQYCNEINIPEDVQGTEFVVFLSGTLGQLIGGSYSDEVEILDISQGIKNHIVGIACKYNDLRAA